LTIMVAMICDYVAKDDDDDKNDDNNKDDSNEDFEMGIIFKA